MNKRTIGKYILMLLVGGFCWFNFYRWNQSTNKLECEIVADEVKGVVIERSNAHYQSYYIDSKKK